MSEVARLKKQIEMECETMKLAMTGFRMAASHDIIIVTIRWGTGFVSLDACCKEVLLEVISKEGLLIGSVVGAGDGVQRSTIGDACNALVLSLSYEKTFSEGTLLANETGNRREIMQQPKVGNVQASQAI